MNINACKRFNITGDPNLAIPMDRRNPNMNSGIIPMAIIAMLSIAVITPYLERAIYIAGAAVAIKIESPKTIIGIVVATRTADRLIGDARRASSLPLSIDEYVYCPIADKIIIESTTIEDPTALYAKGSMLEEAERDPDDPAKAEPTIYRKPVKT